MTPEAPFRIHLLGGIELRWQGRKLPPFPTQKSRSLFSYLVLHRQRFHQRDVLAGTFWGDRPDREARSCLRTDIWRVRKLLESGAREGGRYLHVNRQELGFQRNAAYWLDIQVFEALLGDCVLGPEFLLSQDAAAAFEEAVALYRGDLLEGVYEDWLLVERERLRELLLVALDRLMEYHSEVGDWHHAVTHGQRLLGLDPLREHVHRGLMRLHYQRGDRAAALRQFEVCRRLLRRELHVDPMEETLQLRRAIANQEAGLTRARGMARMGPLPVRRKGQGARPSPESIDSAVKELNVAGHLVKRARERLQRSPHSEQA